MKVIEIGIVTVRGAAYPPTQRLASAARQRGHRVQVIDPYRVWPALTAAESKLLPAAVRLPDVVMPRQGAEVASACLSLIAQYQLMGITVINRLEGIRIARHKFFSSQALGAARIAMPDTVFINSPQGLAPAVDQLGGYPVVIKTLSGRQGSGVILATSAKAGETAVHTHLQKRRGLLIQRFIDPSGRTDIRVLVVGGHALAAMSLTPNPGDFRANYHLTKKSRPFELVAPVSALAVAATRALGLDIAGVDLIQTASGELQVIEVNYAPGFRGLESATGLDIAGRIIDYAIQRIGG